MQSQTTTFRSSTLNPILSKVGFVVLAIFLVLAVVIFVTAPVLAIKWINHPYLGSFVENTLVVSTTKPFFSSHELIPGTRIVAVNDEPVKNVHELNKKLSAYVAGMSVDVTFDNIQGGSTTIPIKLEQISGFDLFSFVLFPYILGLGTLGTGLWVFTARRDGLPNQFFVLFTTAVSLAFVLYFDTLSTNRLVYFWLFCLALASGSLITLGLVYPEEDPWTRRWPFLRWLGFIIGFIIFLYALPWQFNQNVPNQYMVSWRFFYFFIAVGLLLFIGWTIYRFRRSAEPGIREQSRLTLIGIGLGIFPILIWQLINLSQLRLNFSPLLLISFLIFPLTIAYNLSRSRSLRTDFIASQVLLYSTLTIISAIGYGILVTGAVLMTNEVFQISNPFFTGIAVFILALAVLPLRERLQKSIDRLFGRDDDMRRRHIQSFSHDLTQAMDSKSISILVRKYLIETIAPTIIHIFLNSPGSDYYVALPAEDGNSTSDLVFSKDSGLVDVLTKRRSAIYLGNMESIPAPLVSEQARLGLLGAQVYIPLPGRERLIGWIALGQSSISQLYSYRELNFIEALSDQTALAYERAQVVQDLERRVKQMNVLTRMTQGINVTITFDDLLEFIFAQSNQIIPTRDFRIALLDNRSGMLSYAFYLENDERLTEFENRSVPENEGLEGEIIRQGRTIITDDYERECRNLNSIPNPKGIYAWIGVPLNTGADTIGVLSTGSRDPSVIFTSDQANLIQAIADQAAGAILKAGLLEEAERRALQLATLNEVAQSLSSTLELVPLFNKILRSAVEILNCAAGSLLLIDDETGEYVFEAAVGEVADNLIGTRLPPGTGLVGKAIQTREALIVNDVRRSDDWSRIPDQNTGFRTNDLLVIPMIYRDDVTGVLEVLNRRDGQPFTQDDQELLSAFASQAAVALENARLFTLTDQTLAERVEELSVLQRIDRELNTSLDIDRALRVTLEWAMRQSNVDAGLIGILEDDHIKIMASQGYQDELIEYEPSGLPTWLPMINSALETGLPQFIEIDRNSLDNRQSILNEAKQQVVIPLRREAQVIGLVLLESRNPGTSEDENIGFLTRLGDHASVAITNATLYAEVQAANQAKSDFVSFVSHELKTPMTSIRGFTDLLSSGVVGEVNENQTNFLSTIRSNVERMATLVSDLADVSRIEAGRMRLEFGAVGVSEIVEEVVRSTRAQILEKKQTLIINVPDDLPQMWGDKIRIIQILTNLVSNAYKYTPVEGLIQITAEIAENIWSKAAPQVIHILVRDNGYGISHENQTRIFQKFYRSEDQKIRDAPGTGLGLNITKQLVELQGGTIWFESTYREGTTFHFTVPIAEEN